MFCFMSENGSAAGQGIERRTSPGTVLHLHEEDDKDFKSHENSHPQERSAKKKK